MLLKGILRLPGLRFRFQNFPLAMNPFQQIRQWTGLFVGIFVFGIPSMARAELPLEGFLEPYQRVELAASEPGVVVKLLVQEGDRVTSGQLLAQLENNPLAIAVELAQTAANNNGQIQAAQAEKLQRSRRLEGLQQLREKGHATQEEIFRAQVDLEIAEANLLVAQEQQRMSTLELKRAESLLERRNVRSTLQGVVNMIYHQPGEFVAATSPALFSIVQTDKLRVNFAVPPQTKLPIQVGQTVPVQLSDSNQRAAGVVEFISPVTDPESGTIRVRVVIDNTAGSYPCGVKCVLIPKSISPAPSQDKQ